MTKVAHRLVGIASVALALLAGGCGDRDAAKPPERSMGTGSQTPPAAWFTDITADSGLDFVHQSLPTDGHHLPAVSTGGAALLDYDADGDLDLYLVNAAHVLPAERAKGGPVNRLYRREPDGRYVDVTAEAGVGDPGYGMGAAVGDIDNDGRVDLFVTNYGPDRLYRNRGDGTFEDVTRAAGVAVDGFSSSAAFCDFDADGRLDLYVVRYVEYLPGKRCRGHAGRPDFCGPQAFRPVADMVLHNRTAEPGVPRFRDVTEAAGVAAIAGPGLGLVCLDADGDGRQDVYVANDGAANQLWIQEEPGGGAPFAFRDDSLVLGAAYNLHGQAEAGMGVVAEDFDGDGRLDLFLTHLMNEANTLYQNLGEAAGYRDISGASGLGPSSMPFTGFGVLALDAELDGDLDLVISNGKVNVAGEVAREDYPFPWDRLPERLLFYRNDGGGRFERFDEALSPAFRPEIGRAIVGGDLDADGDVDFVVVNAMGPARIYRNDAPRQGHWLALRTLDPALGRDAIGARVTVVAGERSWVRQVAVSYGYLASHSPELHFGLGAASAYDRIEVRWPGGDRELFTGGRADRSVTLERGRGKPADG